MLSWSRREVVLYPVLPMTLIQVTNGDFSIHSEIDTSVYLFILISWWASGILEGAQDFDGRRILFLLDAAVYVPRLSLQSTCRCAWYIFQTRSRRHTESFQTVVRVAIG
jgi:hypothetical protein